MKKQTSFHLSKEAKETIQTIAEKARTSNSEIVNAIFAYTSWTSLFELYMGSMAAKWQGEINEAKTGTARTAQRKMMNRVYETNEFTKEGE
jgi:predicted transcriptional regulator